MLALHPPSMGSRQPPNCDLPFGFSLEGDGPNYPLPSPAAPAPGPSLLDEHEFRLLDSFLDGVESDQPSLEYSNTNGEPNSRSEWESMSRSFIEVPTLCGLATPGVQCDGLSDVNFDEMKFLQNFSHRRSQSLESGVSQLMTFNVPERPQLMFQPATGLVPLSQENPEEFISAPTHSNLIFGEHTVGIPRNRALSQTVGINWGSDSGFQTPQGFSTSSNRDNLSDTERYHLRTVPTALSLPFQNPISASNICPLSPQVKEGPMSHQIYNSAIQEFAEDDESSGSNKRRKFDFPDEDEEDDYQFLPSSSNRMLPNKRKASMREFPDPSPLEYESSHKRRRSTVCSMTKTTRENLTEEQKRENHIKSEQKRRTLIREGFEDLNELVPGLQGSGYSKSVVLTQTADWLEKLIKGNRTLQSRINNLKANK